MTTALTAVVAWLTAVAIGGTIGIVCSIRQHTADVRRRQAADDLAAAVDQALARALDDDEAAAWQALQPIRACPWCRDNDPLGYSPRDCTCNSACTGISWCGALDVRRPRHA